MTTSRKILVTSALPYANGPIHLGHLVEYIQTDIWVRAMKAMGHNVTYVCADDAHGTAIMLKAQDNGITPEEQIATVKASHEKDFAGFLIDFDNYHSTHSSENQYFSQKIYTTLKQNGYIFTKDVEQLFDTEKGLFWLTVLSKALVLNATHPINTAIIAKSALAPTMPPN